MAAKNPELVGIKVETMFFVLPDQITPELYERMQEMVSGLGTLAVAGSEPTTRIKLEGIYLPDEYAERKRKEQEQTQQIAEMAQRGSVLDTSVHDLARRRKRPLPAAMVDDVDRLEGCGLGTARSLLAVGHYTVLGTRANIDSDVMNRITSGLQERELTLPKLQPNVAQVALLCGTLDDVPGYVLMSFSTPAENHDSQLETMGLKKRETQDTINDNGIRDAWRNAGLLNMRVSELSSLTVADLAQKITEDTITYGNSTPLECAQKLHDTIRAYAQQFDAAKARQAKTNQD